MKKLIIFMLIIALLGYCIFGSTIAEMDFFTTYRIFVNTANSFGKYATRIFDYWAKFYNASVEIENFFSRVLNFFNLEV